MNVLVSAMMFAILVFLGNVLMFINEVYYVLIFFMLLYLICLKFIYHEANCKTIELKDFVVAFIFTALASMLMELYHQRIDTTVITYLYLISFISIMMFVDSVRFKSLM